MSDPTIDLAPFKRTVSTTMLAGGLGRFSLGLELHAIAQLGYGMDPNAVPVVALQLMMKNPAIYLAFQTISGIIRRPDLYSVVHPDPKIRAEVEAWLWPLLPRLLASAARGFAYGTVADVLDWERSTLRIKSTNEETKKARQKTLVQHTHYSRVGELHPDATTFELDQQGEILSVQSVGGSYGKDRVAVWLWDPEFGDLIGQAALRRCWRDYCEHIIVTILRDKYLERSVDAPRIVYAPPGKITVDGTEWEIPDYVVYLVQELRGSGAIGLPSAREASGEKKYEVDQLNIPDRAEVWDQALSRIEANLFIAFLVAPTLGGGLDDVSGSGGKTLDGMLREHVESLANFAADGLSRLVGLVHRANYDPEKVEPPSVIATDVGKAAARKIMQEVLRLANSAARGEIALRTDVPTLLDKLGIPLREAPVDPFEQPDPSAPKVPQTDPGSAREERRDESRTEEGEEDTGDEDAGGEDRDEQD